MQPESPEGCCETAHAGEDATVRGILLALRYLSREAKDAGLKDLAKALEEAERKYGWHTGTARSLA